MREVDQTVSIPSTAPISVVVPAKNEVQTIARVVETLSAISMIDEVVVVDNGSTDNTDAVARASGARVIAEDKPGMGHAIRAGFMAARNDWVMKVDADLDKFDIALFSRMIEARAPGVGLVKGMWQDPRDPMPMTRYLVMPALRLMFPGLSGLKAPNSGIYTFDRSLIAVPEIVGNYAADLDVMVRVHTAGARVAEVDIGRIDNNPRDAGHYSTMSETIMGFFLRQRDLRITEELVLMADDAGDVVRFASGMLCGHARSGGRVSVYLGESVSDMAAALQEALKDFPTARTGPLSSVSEFRPGGAASRLRLFAPVPVGGHGDAFKAALSLCESSDPVLDPELLLIPSQNTPQTGFRADRTFDIAEGMAAKEALFAKVGQPTNAMLPTEVFQCYPLTKTSAH